MKTIKPIMRVEFRGFWKLLILLTFLLTIVILLMLIFEVKTGERIVGETLRLSLFNSIEGYGEEVISYSCNPNVQITDLRGGCEGCSLWFELHKDKGNCGLVVKEKYKYLGLRK